MVQKAMRSIGCAAVTDNTTKYFMPFTQQVPRPFTYQGVVALDTDQYGVYGIFKNSQWIYIGKGDIRTRLLAHLDGDNPLILKAEPTHFVAELCEESVMSEREKQLILACDPLCNKRVG